jgi:hypothetical protein
MTSGPTMLTPRAWPSAAALATAAVPVLPLAPGRFSTTNGCPSLACRRSATMRVSTSGVDPALKGTNTVTPRWGHAWAAAGCHISA